MIAEWVLFTLVITGCLGAIAFVASEWLQSHGRPTRHLWMAVSLLSVLIPAMMAVRPRVIRSIPVARASVPGRQITVTPVDRVVQPSWPLILWSATSTLMLLGLGATAASIHRVRRRARVESWDGTLVALTRDAGPGVAPFGHPEILVPAWVAQLSANDRKLLVYHEKSHVDARDARWLFLASLVLVATPWNVPLWWCWRRLRTAMELDCDARVLAAGAPLRQYAELLLQAAASPGRRLAPGLLTFAHSRSQLHTRIDAMTAEKSLSPLRRAATGALALVALVAACETRRPEPLAPVADYVLEDGQAKTIEAKGREGDSIRVSLAGVVNQREVKIGFADDASQPLLVVEDASGGVVYSGRADVSGALKQVSADAIERVEVIKRGDLLPPEAKSGLIKVKLKPGATWPGAAADSAAGVGYRAPAAISPREWAERATISISPGTRAKRPAPSGGEPSVTFRVGNRVTGDSVTVELLNSDGSVFYSGRIAGSAGFERIGPYMLNADDIARGEVHTKMTPGGLIQIYLKPGVTPKRAAQD